MADEENVNEDLDKVPEEKEEDEVTPEPAKEEEVKEEEEGDKEVPGTPSEA